MFVLSRTGTPSRHSLPTLVRSRRRDRREVANCEPSFAEIAIGLSAFVLFSAGCLYVVAALGH